MLEGNKIGNCTEGGKLKKVAQVELSLPRIVPSLEDSFDCLGDFKNETGCAKTFCLFRALHCVRIDQVLMGS